MSQRRRIILVLHEPPLPFGGAAARWYWVLLRELVARRHSVTTFVPVHSDQQIDATLQHFPGERYDLRFHRIEPTRNLISRARSALRPFSYQYPRAMRDEILNELSRCCDVVHLEQLWSGWLDLQRFERVVANVHYLTAIDSAHASRVALATKERLLAHRARTAERSVLRRYHNFATLTPRLSTAVSEINPAARVWTAPMALDLSLYEFREPAPRNVPTVGLIGSFNWTPTIDAGVRLVERIWPLVRARVPAARLLIVGRRARAALAAQLSTPGIEIVEDVPDVIPHFRQSDVMVYAPTAASGMKVKVMEAFALGVPVVTNGEGIEGLSVDRGGGGVVLADTDDAIADATVALLTDPDRRRAQAIAARRLLEREHSPAAAVDRWEAIYSMLCGAEPESLTSSPSQRCAP